MASSSSTADSCFTRDFLRKNPLIKEVTIDELINNGFEDKELLLLINIDTDLETLNIALAQKILLKKILIELKKSEETDFEVSLQQKIAQDISDTKANISLVKTEPIDTSIVASAVKSEPIDSPSGSSFVVKKEPIDQLFNNLFEQCKSVSTTNTSSPLHPVITSLSSVMTTSLSSAITLPLSSTTTTSLSSVMTTPQLPPVITTTITTATVNTNSDFNSIVETNSSKRKSLVTSPSATLLSPIPTTSHQSRELKRSIDETLYNVTQPCIMISPIPSNSHQSDVSPKPSTSRLSTNSLSLQMPKPEVTSTPAINRQLVRRNRPPIGPKCRIDEIRERYERTKKLLDKCDVCIGTRYVLRSSLIDQTFAPKNIDKNTAEETHALIIDKRSESDSIDDNSQEFNSNQSSDDTLPADSIEDNNVSTNDMSMTTITDESQTESQIDEEEVEEMNNGYNSTSTMRSGGKRRKRKTSLTSSQSSSKNMKTIKNIQEIKYDCLFSKCNKKFSHFEELRNHRLTHIIANDKDIKDK